MEEKLVSLLIEKKMTITTVESCTGGMVASKIVNVSGASEVFSEGFITYANRAKETYAGVLKETLDKYGAVSSQVAMEMAEGAAKKTGADVVVSVTGIAGPNGGTKEKPVGLVYIGCFVCGKSFFKKCHFQGDRLEVREQSTSEAICFAYELIKDVMGQEDYSDRRDKMNQSIQNGFCPKCGALMRQGVCQSCEFSVNVNPMPQYTYQGQGFSADMMMGVGIPPHIEAPKKNKTGLVVGIIIAGVCVMLAIVVVILIAMYILANSSHISEKKPDIVSPKEDEYIYDYDEEESDFAEEDFSDNYNFNENSDMEIPPLDEEIWGDVWDDFEKYSDEYPMITDYIRDDLSYSVYFEKYEDEDKTVQCTYPVIEGEKEYVPYLNQMFNRFAEETKTVAEKYQCTAISDAYVTYMDEEVMSVVFIEVYSVADESTFECIYCYTMDIESGGLIEFELKDDSDEVLSEMEKRCREQSTDDAEHIFSTYSKEDIRTFLKETENSFVAFFTPYGMELGLCYEGYWCCATFKDYEEYVMIAQDDETEF